ncbi:hypothetical protein CR513_38442, partial [Mucuna pruriens]
MIVGIKPHLLGVKHLIVHRMLKIETIFQRKKMELIFLKVQNAPRGSSSKAIKVKESSIEESKEEESNKNKFSFIFKKINSMWKNKGGSRWKNYSKRFTKETRQKFEDNILSKACNAETKEKDKETNIDRLRSISTLDLSAETVCLKEPTSTRDSSTNVGGVGNLSLKIEKGNVTKKEKR